jgi:hypothetical protein
LHVNRCHICVYVFVWLVFKRSRFLVLTLKCDYMLDMDVIKDDINKCHSAFSKWGWRWGWHWIISKIETIGSQVVSNLDLDPTWAFLTPQFLVNRSMWYPFHNVSNYWAFFLLSIPSILRLWGVFFVTLLPWMWIPTRRIKGLWVTTHGMGQVLWKTMLLINSKRV